MKTYISLFAFMAIFFFGTNLTMSQDTKIKQDEYALKKRQFAESQNSDSNNDEMTPESNAKQQAQDLEVLLKLDEKQLLEAYNLFLSTEKELSTLSDLNDEKGQMEKINNLQLNKEEKLKEILNPDQYALYLNSFKK